jgi:hypothetical protein
MCKMKSDYLFYYKNFEEIKFWLFGIKHQSTISFLHNRHGGRLFVQGEKRRL